MTDTKQPEALRLADWCETHSSGIYRPSADAAEELRRLHAENTTLQQGYDAARLEIESLHAHIKGLIAERDAAYEVAMMNAKSGAAWAEDAQADSQPALPKITAEDRSFLHYNPNTDDIVEWVQHYASAAITADRALRAQAAPAAVAGPMQLGGCPECGSRSCVARQCSLVNATSQMSPVAQGGAEDVSDTTLLNILADEYLDLRAFSIPTGQGDADVGWRVIQHHMGVPTERVVSEVYKDDLRSAIRAAIVRLKRDPYCTGALHEEDAARTQAKEGASHG